MWEFFSDSSDTAGTDPRPTETASGAARPAAPPFVGREPELARLHELLSRALNGQGQVVFVTGEAGTGKTALVGEFLRRAQEQNAELVLALGECNSQTGQSDAYLPFKEIFRLLMGDVEGDLEEKALTRENANRLRQLMSRSADFALALGPDLIGIFLPWVGIGAKAGAFILDRMRGRGQQPAAAPRETLTQDQLFEQFSRVILRLAGEQPLVLLLDDLQWADAASLELLFYLGRKLKDAHILLIGTYRPNDVALGRDGGRHPLERVVNELKRYYGQIEIDLSAASEGATGLAFVNALLDTEPNRLGPGFRSLLFDRTGGHPLFTIELLRALQERGDLVQDASGYWMQAREIVVDELPARVEAVIEERINRLDKELHNLLASASVMGEEFVAQVVAEISEADEDEVLEALSDELDKRHRLVRESGEVRIRKRELFQFHFRHALFQKHLYDELGGFKRKRLHKRVAACLEELYGDQAARVAVQLGWHFEQAGDYDKAATYLLVAANHARRSYAADEARSLYWRALSALEKSEGDEVVAQQAAAYEGLGDVAAQQSRYGEALEQYQAAMQAVEALHDDMHLVELYRKRAGVFEKKEAFADAMAACEAARVRLGERPDVAPALARVLTQMAEITLAAGELNPATHYCDQALALLDHSPIGGLDQERTNVLHTLGRINLALGETGKARGFFTQALRIREVTGDLDGQAASHNALGATLDRVGQSDDAYIHYEQALKLVERIGNVRAAAILHLNLGAMAHMRGDYEGALAHYRECVRLAEDVGAARYAVLGLSNIGELLCDVGRYSEAKEPLERARTGAEALGTRAQLPHIYWKLGEAYRGQGELDTARQTAQQALVLSTELGLRWEQGCAHSCLGVILTQAGELAEAEKDLRQAITIFEELDSKYELANACRAYGLLWQARGDRDQARTHLERALTLFQALGNQKEIAQTQTLFEAL